MSFSKNTKKEFGTVKIWNERGLDMTNNKIRNVADPVLNKDGVNKSYVDGFRSVGDLKWSIKNSDHSGWLLCDGRSVQRAGYPELFALIGTSFGSADGNTFNLPNSKGRVLGAIGQGSGLTNRSLGDSVGAETHTLTSSEMPIHNHTGTTASAGEHSHTSNANGGQGGLGLVTANGANTETDVDSSLGELNLWTTPVALTIDSSGAHTHAFTSGSTGGGQAHNNMQPTLFIGNVFVFSGIMGI